MVLAGAHQRPRRFRAQRHFGVVGQQHDRTVIVSIFFFKYTIRLEFLRRGRCNERLDSVGRNIDDRSLQSLCARYFDNGLFPSYELTTMVADVDA